MSIMHPELPPRTFPCRWEGDRLCVDCERGRLWFDRDEAEDLAAGRPLWRLDALHEHGYVRRASRPAFLASVRRALNIAAG